MPKTSKLLSSFLFPETPPNLQEKNLLLNKELQRKFSLAYQQIYPADEPGLFRFTREVIQKSSSSHIWTVADKIDALGLFARIDPTDRNYIFSESSRLIARTESLWDPQSRLQLFYLLSKPDTYELQDLIDFTIWLCNGRSFSAKEQLSMTKILLSVQPFQRKIFAEQIGEIFYESKILSINEYLLRCQEFSKLSKSERDAVYKENQLSKGVI